MILVRWQNIAGQWIFGSVKGGKCFCLFERLIASEE
jgi:hypothetical protein